MRMNPIVLSEMATTDPRVTWQARKSADRGRLEVIARVQVGAEVVEVELPTARLLEAWLEGRTHHEEEQTMKTTIVGPAPSGSRPSGLMPLPSPGNNGNTPHPQGTKLPAK